MKKLKLIFAFAILLVQLKSQTTVTLKNIPYIIHGELTGTFIDSINPDSKIEFYFGVVKDSVYYSEIEFRKNIPTHLNKNTIALSDLGISKKNWSPAKIEKSFKYDYLYDLAMRMNDPNKDIIKIEITSSLEDFTRKDAALHFIFADKSKAEATLEMLRKLAKKK